MAIIYYFAAAILAAISFAIYQLATLGAAMSDQQQAIDALTAQVDKISTEVTSAHAAIVTELDIVRQQLADSNTPVDLTALTDAVQKLDDLNPDAVVPSDVPVDEPVDPSA
jgi:cell division protein FtsB